MPLVPVSLPPGVRRSGTVEQSKARFYDCNLVLWRDGGLLTQMLGWAPRDPEQTPLNGKPRACLAWQDNSGNRWIAVGTNQKLYVQSAAGTVFDITRAGFVAGAADASVLTGYGVGGYGVGTYGTPRPDTGAVIPAAMQSLALWNDKLVGVMAEDGRIYEWTLDGSTPAAVIANAPTGVQAIMVTAEGFLVALYNRTVRWSDQANNTIWTQSDTNQARKFELQTSGSILAGCKIPGATLIVTTTDAHVGIYQGYPLVYGFQQVGSGCGMVSRGALQPIDQRAVWMGREGFFIYDGFVQPLPCDIADLVFGDINEEQLTKITCGHRAADGEVWWNYCSAGSTEIDRQVIWNYRLGVWYPCRLERSCMADAGVFNTPIMVSPDGYIYAHEVGFDYDGAEPYAETGPLRLGTGERLLEVHRLIPDEKTSGDLEVTFYAREFPMDSDVTHGPYALTSPTDVDLFQAGRIRIRYTFIGSSKAIVGDFMLDLKPGDPIL